MICKAVIYTLEVQTAKQIQLGDFKPVEAGPEVTFINGTPVQILKNPIPPLSEQKAPTVTKESIIAQLQEGNTAKKSYIVYINEVVRKILGIKPSLILKDLICISPVYTEYLIAYIRQI